jgi:hypothetical protein
MQRFTCGDLLGSSHMIAASRGGVVEKVPIMKSILSGVLTTRIVTGAGAGRREHFR